MAVLGVNNVFILILDKCCVILIYLSEINVVHYEKIQFNILSVSFNNIY